MTIKVLMSENFCMILDCWMLIYWKYAFELFRKINKSFAGFDWQRAPVSHIEVAWWPLPVHRFGCSSIQICQYSIGWFLVAAKCACVTSQPCCAYDKLSPNFLEASDWLGTVSVTEESLDFWRISVEPNTAWSLHYFLVRIMDTIISAFEWFSEAHYS